MSTQIHFQKFKNLVTKNCMLTSKSLHKIIPKFCDWLTFSFESHQNSTRPAKNGCILHHIAVNPLVDILLL